MSSRPNSRPVSRQPSRSGTHQYPAPDYGNQPYTAVPASVPPPTRDQQYSPNNQGYATSDPVDQSQGNNADYKQQNPNNNGIQLGAYPSQGFAAGVNPAYGQQHPPQYPHVQYGGGGSQELGPLGQYMTNHDQGQGLAPPTVQYPAVLYDQQHSNYAQHEPHTQPHPASAAAAAVLVAHASSLGPDGDGNTKFNADGTFASGLDQAEQGQGNQRSPLGQGHGGPLGQGMDVVTQGPLVRTQTHKPIVGPHHASALEAFPAAAGVADRQAAAAHYMGSPGAGVEGAQQWQAPEPAPVDPRDATGPGKRKVPWEGQYLQNVNWLMAILTVAWFVIAIIYIVVRATRSLHLGKATAYGVWVLVMEATGVTTVMIYASHLIFRVRKWTPPLVRQPFSVRVMIPCYKEDIETLEETVECAVEAAKAAMAKGQTNAVHIYLCDDSPKDFKERYNGQTFLTVALRQQMIDALYQVHGVPVIRVTRMKAKGETNPKSANLNNCLKQIYGDAIPPSSEVVAVFDADQAAHSHFFTSTLPWMDAGDDVALVQSPQVFRGVHWSDDVLNHENVGFWHYLQPAYNVMGFISCAGTNFLLRSAPFASAGYFPTHTLTEDYALGMEMRRHGWREVYVEDELVRGSAPDKVRGAFGQRSRWCKGPFQMLLSSKSPLFAKGLNLYHRILYLSPCYIYIIAALGTPTFMAIPIIYIWAGRFPAVLTSTVISWMIAYTVLSYCIKCYVRSGRNWLHDFRAHWNAEVSTKNFWWMYWKAAWNGSISKMGCKQLGWTPGAGGGKANNCYTKLCEARGDLYPAIFFAIVLLVSIIYGFFMVGAGARFVGPLGISIIWAIYHAIAPWLLIFYSLLPFRHEVEKKVVLYNVGRSIFFVIVNLCFAFSYVCFVACIVLAYKTKDLSSYNSGYNNGVYHLGVKETFRYIGNHGRPSTSSTG